MTTFEKKILKVSFDELLSGKKKFERRLQDFDVKEGDTLVLREWDQTLQAYTGRVLEKKVTHVGKFRIDKDHWSEQEIKEKGLQVISLE